MKRLFNKQNRGFMLVEALVSISIFVLLIIATTFMIQKSLELSRRTTYNSQANFLIEEGVEVVRFHRQSVIDTLDFDIPYFLVFVDLEGLKRLYYWDFQRAIGTDPFCVGCPTLINGTFSRQMVISRVYRDVNGDIAETGTIDTGTRLITIYVYWKDKESIENGTYKTKSLSFYTSNIFQ